MPLCGASTCAVAGALPKWGRATAMSETADTVAEVIAALVRAAPQTEPDDLPHAVAHAAAQAGASAVGIYLADYQQLELREYVHPNRDPAPAQHIDSTLAGRAFRTEHPVEVSVDGGRQLWLPLLDSSHRIGVLTVTLGAEEASSGADWLGFAALVADLLITKSAYGDGVHSTRRRRPVALRAEAQGALLPPLTSRSPRVFVSGILEPSYEVAGDLFDYALNDDVLHGAILDAMGHSLGATLTATVAVTAFRNARRQGGTLLEQWAASNRAVTTEFGGDRFATATLIELDLLRGRLRTISAGHPPALVLRDHHASEVPHEDHALPLGLATDEPKVVEIELQPGDQLVLFTDGVVEGRSPGGEFFGERRLVDHITRELDSGLPAPEVLRRLIRAVIDHQHDRLRDDATVMLVEWRGADKAGSHPASR